MASAEPSGTIRVEVAYSAAPRQVDVAALTMPAGCTVAQALQASGLLQRHGLQAAELQVGIWSRVVALDSPLRERDRVEIYRPLKVDPKEARRQRYKGQRERRARGAGGEPPPA